MFNVPLPQSVTFEPSLHFITAFSAFVFPFSSLLFSVSLNAFSVFSAASIVTSELFAHTIGAVSCDANVKPFKIICTPVVPFFTFTLPFVQLPDNTYVPDCVIVRFVPSTSIPEDKLVLIALSVKVILIPSVIVCVVFVVVDAVFV